MNKKDLSQPCYNALSYPNLQPLNDEKAIASIDKKIVRIIKSTQWEFEVENIYTLGGVLTGILKNPYIND